jgi:HD-like signal output (HDOD) protein
MRRVLFVDDERPLLDGLSKALRPFRHQWVMRFSITGEEALQLMEQEPFDVVISDARMPGMDGERLLREVQRRWPSTLRIVLSGQTDKEAARRLLIVAHQFLSKPCPSKLLFDTVERACMLGDLLETPLLKDAICGLALLPSLPGPHARLEQALSNPAVDLATVAAIVSTDPGLAARALQMVNSAFFGLARPVATIHEAVFFLGLEACAEVLRSTRVLVADPSLLDTLARRTACLATVSSQLLDDSPEAQIAYAAGLLCELGVMVLAARLGPLYATVWRDHVEGTTLCQAEVLCFGTNHCEVGAGLLGLWNFPPVLVDAVGFHHTPSGAGPHGSSSVRSAVQLAAAIDEEDFAPRSSSRVGQSRQIADALGLSPQLASLRSAAVEAR